MQMREVSVSDWFAAAKTETITGTSLAAFAQPGDEPPPAQHAPWTSPQAPNSPQVPDPSKQDDNQAQGVHQPIATSLQFAHAHPGAHEALSASDDSPTSIKDEGNSPGEQERAPASPTGINPADPTLILDELALDESQQALDIPVPPTMDEAGEAHQDTPTADGPEEAEHHTEQPEVSPADGLRRLQAFQANVDGMAAPSHISAANFAEDHGGDGYDASAEPAIAIERNGQTEPFIASPAAEPQRLRSFQASAGSQAAASGNALQYGGSQGAAASQAAASRRALQSEALQMTAGNAEQPVYDFLSGIYERKDTAEDIAVNEPGMSATLAGVSDSHESDLAAWIESLDDLPGLDSADAMVERWRLQAQPMGSGDQLDAADKLHIHDHSKHMGRAGPLHAATDHKPHVPHDIVPLSKAEASLDPRHVVSSHDQRSVEERPYAHTSAATAREALEMGSGVQPIRVSPSGMAADLPHEEQAVATASGSQVGEDLRMWQDSGDLLPLFGPVRVLRQPEVHHAQAKHQLEEVHKSDANAAAAGHGTDASVPAHHLDGLAHAAEAAALKPVEVDIHHDSSGIGHVTWEPKLAQPGGHEHDTGPMPSRTTSQQRHLTSHAGRMSALQDAPQEIQATHALSRAAKGSIVLNKEQSSGTASGPSSHHRSERSDKLYKAASSAVHQHRLMAEDAPAWSPESLADKMQSWLDKTAEETPSPLRPTLTSNSTEGIVRPDHLSA